MKEIKIDRTTLPDDQSEVMFIPESTEEPTKGPFVSGDDVFVDESNKVHRVWDCISWCYIEDYEPMSVCCSAPIIGESEICSACKEHC